MTVAMKRAARTFLQGFVGVLVLVAVPALNGLVSAVAGGGEATVDVDVWRGIGIAALAGGLIATISWAQNALEDAGAMRPMLRD
jgi:hypothetical protein